MAQARQTRVVAAAKSHLGKWSWSVIWDRASDQGHFLPTEPKCNLFVAEMLAQGGFEVPLVNGAGKWRSWILDAIDAKAGRPPTAQQWYNHEVPATTMIGSGQVGLEKSWPGDIITDGKHIGIITGPQKTIHVSKDAAPMGSGNVGVREVTESQWGWLPAQWASMKIFRYHP
jgi:hypothetical protein